METIVPLRDGSVLPPPSKEVVAEYEDWFGIRWPEEYLEFLRSMHGGSPFDTALVVDGHRYRFKRFLLLLGEEARHSEIAEDDIANVLTVVRSRMTPPEDADHRGMHIIPFASLYGDEYLCFDFRSQPPRIVLWDVIESKPLAPVFHAVADNFGGLLVLLRARCP